MLRDDQIRLLNGLPNHWRYALTGGNDDAKRCFEEGWNERGNGRTLEDVIRLNTAPNAAERWKSRKTIGLGVITGEESNGLLVIDFDGVGSQAVRAFRKHFRRFPSELPKTIANMSGKVGRAKLFFTVPPHWWPQLEARSASWRDDQGAVVLEAIWENSTNRGRHAVICGDHPDSSHQRPLFYRWAPKAGPTEVGVAEAPEWLLLGVIAQMERSGGELSRQERLRTGADDATPWERLTAFERMQLVQEALPHCPHRLARGSGTYEKVRRIMCGVLNEFGFDVALTLLTQSEWDKRNEWEGTTCAKTLESLYKSKVSEDHKSRIASVFYFAREAGWQPPSWAIPPVDMKVHVEGLKKLINQFHAFQGDAAAVATILGRARREFGVEPEVLRRLSLEQFLGTMEQNKAQTLTEISAHTRTDNILTDVIDGFLSRRVHVLAGASHSGKTTFACFLANRVIHGMPVDVDNTRHSSEQKGRVLIFTSDCSNTDMVRDLALEGVEPQSAEDRVRICSGVSFDEMLYICRMLEEWKPDFVVYDCLTSMACKDVKIGDPAYADPIRQLVRHNGQAWPRCAHLILHHTSRDEPTRFSGTEQIKAAAEELWLYYPPELLKWRKGQPRPQIGPSRHLVMEKSRNGYAGKALMVTRNAYQGSWQLRRPDLEGGSPLDQLGNVFRAVQHDEWKIASEWAKELDLGFNSRSLRRYLDQLVGTVLESARMRSRITGRMDTHYRPRAVVREAARDMRSSRGDGVNLI